MAEEPPEPWIVWGRNLGLAVVAIAALIVLGQQDREAVRPIIVAVALVTSWGVGRALRAVGLPAVLGWLATGLVLGPAVSALVGQVWPDWPFSGGLIGVDALGAQTGSPKIALAIALVWTGAQLDVRSVSRVGSAAGLLLLGHLLVTVALAAAAAWFMPSGAAATPAAILRGPADLVAVAITLTGASSLLAAAVLHGRTDRADVAHAVLWVAVGSEVLALLALGLWQAQTEAITDLVRLVFSIGVGAVVGMMMAGVVRWMPSGRGPSVVFMAAVASIAAVSAGLSPGLVGLTAGFVLRQLAPGEVSMALHLAAGFALLVVFTSAGAQLPLDSLWSSLPLGAGVALVRTLLLLTVAVGVARLTRAKAWVVRYAWSGLLSSGIPVVGLVAWSSSIGGLHGEDGTTLMWSVAAVDGIIGALGMHVALAFAGEHLRARSARRARRSRDASEHLAALPEGPMRDQAEGFVVDLHHVVDDLRQEELDDFVQQTVDYLDDLRREFRRHHRKMRSVLASDDPDRSDAALRAREEFVDRWRSHVFDHAARMNRHPWQPTQLVELLDRLVQSSAADVAAPPVQSGGNVWQQGFRAFTGWLVGATPRESVPWRDLLAYHFSGRAPAKLEPVAAALVNAELHLAARTRELFHRTLDAYEGLAEQVLDEALLGRIEEDLADDLRAAREEVDAAVDEACTRLTAVFGHLVRDLTADLQRIGSLDLPARMRTLARVKGEREAGMVRLTEAYDDARESARIRFSALTLEIELVGLELEVERALGEHGSLLARLVRGRGTTQLERVEEALDDGLARVEALLGTDQTGNALAEALREEALTVSRVVNDAVDSADALREQLASDEALAPLLDAMVRAGNTLTDRYDVPVGVPVVGSWALPGGCDTTEVAFREVVLAYIETSITRDLHDLTHRYASELATAIGAMEDVDRVVGFNAELAAAELLAAGDTPIDSDQRAAVREIVLEGVARNRGTLADALAASQSWFTEVDARVQQAVMDDLDDLRIRIADGRFAEIAQDRSSLTAQRAVRGASDVATLARDVLQGQIGASGIARLKAQLGLPDPEDDDEATVRPERFAAPEPSATIPLSYRRLFSDQALEAGELMGGREAHAVRVKQALADHADARLRTVAVVGPDGVGKPAIVRAALRAMRVKGVHRYELTDLAHEEDVRSWFDRGTHGHVHVVTGFHWLFHAAPGGFGALRAFVDGVLADEGRNAWLVDADAMSWAFAKAAAPLERAFPSVVTIPPLGEPELREAMLARHGMSEFELVFAEVRDPRRAPRYERAWFRDFHAATGGIARDAMHQWLACIDEVDVHRKRVVMGPAPHARDSAMRLLSDRSALALQVAVRQGWMDEATFARLFREPHLDARAHLAHLVHWGLLVPDGDRYQVPLHLKRALREHLDARGWL